MARGKINNVDYARIIHDFSGLELENGITPTDIDGVMEINDTEWIWLEVKYRGTGLPVGQRLALERTSSAIEETGRQSIVIVAEHDVCLGTEQVDVANCYARATWTHNQWYGKDKFGDVKVRHLIDRWRERNRKRKGCA